MIPTQSNLELYPEFGTNASKVMPDEAKYSNGFVQSDVLPAEWMNWAWSKNTKGITALNSGVKSMEEELNALVAHGGGTPVETDSTQVKTAIMYLINQAKAEAILAAHPVGSLYWTKSTEDPAVTFGGGTWARIKDRFIWAAGDSDTIDGTGGASTVTLTENQIPSHTHTIAHTHTMAHTHTLNSGNTSSSGTIATAGYRGVSVTSAGMNQNETHNHSEIQAYIGSTNYAFGYYARAYPSGSSTPSINIGGTGVANKMKTNSASVAHTHIVESKGYLYGSTDGASNSTTSGSSAANSGSTGGSQAHTNMPPFIVKYCWERTA